jgi:hypothetical protein
MIGHMIDDDYAMKMIKIVIDIYKHVYHFGARPAALVNRT